MTLANSAMEGELLGLRLLTDLKSKRAGSASARAVRELILVHITKVKFQM